MVILVVNKGMGGGCNIPVRGWESPFPAALTDPRFWTCPLRPRKTQKCEWPGKLAFWFHQTDILVPCHSFSEYAGCDKVYLSLAGNVSRFEWLWSEEWVEWNSTSSVEKHRYMIVNLKPICLDNRHMTVNFIVSPNSMRLCRIEIELS